MKIPRDLCWQLAMILRRTFLAHLGLKHTLPSQLVVKVANPSDWHVYNEVFVDGNYDCAIAEALLEAGEAKLQVLDIGANAGYFTLRVADRMLRRSVPPRNFRITLVEGSPRMVKILRQRLAWQPALKGNINIIEGLAGQRTGRARLYETAGHPRNSIVPQRFARKIQASFVDMAQETRGIEAFHLLKCDIEGAEQMVIENYHDILSRTAVAIFEFHHRHIDIKRCLTMLRECGFSAHHVLHRQAETSIEIFKKSAFRQRSLAGAANAFFL